MKILTLFAPGKIAGAEKVVSVGYNAMVAESASTKNQVITPMLCLIKEKSCPSYAEEFKETINDHKEIKIIESQYPIDLQFILKLRAFIKEKSPEIVHTHGYKALIYAFMIKILFSSSLKLVHTHHGNTGHTFKVRVYEKLAFILMRYCNQVISLSPVMTTLLKKQKITQIVEIGNMFSLKSKELPYNEPPGLFNLLYLGRLSLEKNPKTLLNSFSKLHEEYPDIVLNIVGIGPLLDTCKEEYKYNENIIFHGHQENVGPFIQRASYLCLPSLTEGMPMTVIEALCLGTPIIANNVGALEYMCHENNSFLVDIGPYQNGRNPLDMNFPQLEIVWLEILKKAYSTNLKERAMATRTIEQHKYSPSLWAEKTIKLYQNI